MQKFVFFEHWCKCNQNAPSVETTTYEQIIFIAKKVVFLNYYIYCIVKSIKAFLSKQKR